MTRTRRLGKKGLLAVFVHALLAQGAWGGEKGLFLNFGAATGGQLDSTLTDASGAEVGTPGSTGITYGLEGYFQSDGLLGLSGLAEVTPYKNVVGSADWQYFIAAMPRLQFKPIDVLRLWGGVGLGIAITGFGNYRPLPASYEAKSGTGFGVSPRIGMDYDVGEKTFFGIQAALMRTTASINAETSGGAPASVSYDRRWWAFALRIGKAF